MTEMTPLTVVDIRRETATTVSLTLAVPAAQREAFRFKPGQFINVRARIDGEDLQRTYSLCSAPSDEHLRIAIKRIPGGHFSVWANESMRPGMTLDALPPQGRFMLREPDPAHDRDENPPHILALAAGAGITPVISILRHGLKHRPTTRFTLVYGNRNIDDIIFREELEALKDRYVERLTLLHVLSATGQPDTPLLEGRINAAKIEAMGRRLFRAEDVAQAFVCGPGDMIRDTRNALIALGLPRERVQHEFFATAGVPRQESRPASRRQTLPPNGDASSTPLAGEGSAEIVAMLDGARRAFLSRPGESVVEAALRAGIPVPYACKGGMCCTCRARLIEGTATMRVNYSLEAWEIERGFLLTCQAVATSPRLVVDYDQL